MATPEGEIKNAILEYLSYLSDCFVWPVHSVGVYDPIKRIYRKNHSKYHRNGVSDICGIYKARPLAIEVKAPKGVLSDHQKSFINEFRRHGGIAFVARSVEDVREALKNV